MLALKHYPWPGNVRELENVIQRVVVMTEGDLITRQQSLARHPGSNDALRP